MNNLERQKLLSILSHSSILLSSSVIWIIIPIVILLLSTDPIVQQNAKEAINFSLNLVIYFLIALLLSFVAIGIPLLFILLIISWVLPVIAMVQVITNFQQPYHYPFTQWRFI